MGMRQKFPIELFHFRLWEIIELIWELSWLFLKSRWILGLNYRPELLFVQKTVEFSRLWSMNRYKFVPACTCIQIPHKLLASLWNFFYFQWKWIRKRILSMCHWACIYFLYWKIWAKSFFLISYLSFHPINCYRRREAIRYCCQPHLYHQ